LRLCKPIAEFTKGGGGGGGGGGGCQQLRTAQMKN